tara:strand:- start:871 stop:2331 length:1461 start_codon:yes stop_codon:yes gene_type:complete
MASNIKKFLIEKLAKKLNIEKEEIPMSFPDKAFPKLGEPYRPLALPGGPYKLNEMPRLSRSDITDKVPMSYRTGGQQEIKEVVPFKGNLPESFSKKNSNLSELQKIELRLAGLRKKYSKASTAEEKNNIIEEAENVNNAFRGQILSPTRFKKEFIGKGSGKNKGKKSGVSTETKTMPANPDSTILVVNPKGGQSNERAMRKEIVENLGKKPPLTEKPKFKVPTEQKKPEFPVTPIEAVERKTDEGLVTILREKISPSPVKVRPTSRKNRDPNTGKVTVTKGLTTRDPSKGLTEIEVSPNIVSDRLGVRPVKGNPYLTKDDMQSSTQLDSPSKVPVTKSKLGPVEKEGQTARLDFKKITEEEFYALKFQEGLDETGSVRDAANYAEQAVLARDVNQNYTASQIANFMKPKSKPSGNKKARQIKDDLESSSKKGTKSEVSDEVSPSRQAQIEGGDSFKAGGQIKKPVKKKRTIKSSTKGNDLVAMLYN